MSGPYDEMIDQIADPYKPDIEKADGERVYRELTEDLDQDQMNSFDYLWDYSARKEQLPPPGDWRVWMIMAGRGFGKTRAGAEWVRMIADSHPDARIALVSSSLAEARAVMVEGESGLLAICRPGHKPHFEPSLHRIRFENGAQAQLFSAAEPEALRGPQHSHACRSSAEGILRQRGAEPARCAPRPCGDRLAGGSSGEPGGRRVLPGDGDCHRGMGRAGRKAGDPHCRCLALHPAG